MGFLPRYIVFSSQHLNARTAIVAQAPKLLQSFGRLVALAALCGCSAAGNLPPSDANLRAERAGASAAAIPHNVVARVDDNAITREEWELAVRLDRAMSRLAGQPIPDAESTLDRLINARLVLRRAQPQGLTATSQEAEQRLALLKQSWRVDDAAFDAVLADAQLTVADVVEEVRRLLVIEQYLGSLGDAQAAAAWLRAQRAQAQVGIYVDLGARTAEVTTPPPLLQAPSASPVALAVQATLAPSPAPQIEPTPTPPLLETGASPGQAAPDFTLPQLGADASQTLAAYKGQPLILNFWATWCPPCRQEIPALQAAFQQYAGQGVAVLGIDVREEATTVQAFASAMGMQFPILLDTDGTVADRYKVQGIPTTVFVDSAGMVRARHVGPLTESLIAGYLQPLLAQADAPVATAQEVAPAPAPDFDLEGAYGRRARLSDYRGQAQVVLVFYRATTCGSCLIQLAELQHAYDEFRQRGAEVLAIAVQDVDTAGRAAVSAQAAYPILADADHAVSAAYGVYNTLGDGQVTPAVFVIDRAGVIVWSYIGRSAGDRPATEDILAHLN